jgi:hypothetical protein
MTGGVSVALCTYDGERFLREQLASIGAQTLAPAEVVICDDGSTDGTLAVAEGFAASAPFAVRVTRNPARLGATKNYEQAIARCAGPLIALADQDDVWETRKLQRLADAIDGTGAAYAFCDARIVDEEGRILSDHSLLARRFPPGRIVRAFRARRELRLLLKRDFVYGTTLMFQAAHCDLVLPIGEHWSHDTWIVNVLAFAGLPGVPVPEPLVRYRQHAAQASGGFAAPAPAPYSDRVQAYEELRARLAVIARDRTPAPGALARIDDKLRYLRALVEMQGSKQPRKAVIAARQVVSGRWWKYSPRTLG